MIKEVFEKKITLLALAFVQEPIKGIELIKRIHEWKPFPEGKCLHEIIDQLNTKIKEAYEKHENEWDPYLRNKIGRDLRFILVIYPLLIHCLLMN